MILCLIDSIPFSNIQSQHKNSELFKQTNNELAQKVTRKKKSHPQKLFKIPRKEPNQGAKISAIETLKHWK